LKKLRCIENAVVVAADGQENHHAKLTIPIPPHPKIVDLFLFFIIGEKI
jgi:hypothetical protein